MEVSKIKQILELMKEFQIEALKVQDLEIHMPLQQVPVDVDSEKQDPKTMEEIDNDLLFYSSDT